MASKLTQQGLTCEMRDTDNTGEREEESLFLLNSDTEVFTVAGTGRAMHSTDPALPTPG